MTVAGFISSVPQQMNPERAQTYSITVTPVTRKVMKYYC